MPDYFKIGTFDEKSWHGREGNNLLDHHNIEKAMRDSGMLGVEFHKLQSYADWNGVFLPIDGKFQLVMVGAPWAEGKAVPFGRQVSSYEPIQHGYMAKLLQPLIDKSNSQIGLKGVAMVGKNGEVSYVQLDLGEFYVNDHPDEGHKSFLLLSDNKEKGATHWLSTSVRVVCWNTYSLAVGNAPTIPHGATGQTFLEFHAAMLERALRVKAEEKGRMEAFFAKTVTPERIEAAVAKVFPDPGATPAMRAAATVQGKPKDKRIVKMLERAEQDVTRLASQFDLAATRRRECLEEVDNFNDTRPEAADTVYAFWQGVTNVVTHSPTFTGDPWKQGIAQLFLGGQKNNMVQTALVEANAMLRGK